jgi:lysylphosphatidylglycerol synthetase-like protein (DUF2156 family)
VTSTASAPAAAATDADAHALDILRRHGHHTSAFLAYNSETEHFTAPGIDGLVAYRPAGRRHLFQLCGPFAAEEDQDRLLGAFLDWARSEGRRVTAVQLRKQDLERYANAGFVVNQLGSSYSIDLEQFTMRGTRFMKTRNKVSRARRLGLEVQELTPEDLARPEIAAELDAIDATWLRTKGRFAKQLTFMIGERGGRGEPFRRVFMTRLEGKALGYVTYSPAFGDQAGWLYDLTRRHVEAPPGAVELIFHTVVEKLREEGCRWLHLGLTPLVGLDLEHEAEGAFSEPVRRFVTLLSERGEKVYPAKTQEQFKTKWGPHVIEPEYMGFQKRPTIGAVWGLLRLTRAV